MIRLLYPGLPSEGQIQWETAELPFVEGHSLAGYLNVPEELLELVVCRGEVIPAADVATRFPIDGDEIHVLPKMAGKNRSVIVGALSAILIAVESVYAPYLIPWTLAYLAVVNVAAAFLNHPPRPKTDNSKSVPGFAGDSNAEVAGVAQPVVLGDVPKTFGVRVSSFVRAGQYADNLQIRSLTGAASVTAGNNTITGTGTKFTTELTPGDSVLVAGNSRPTDSYGHIAGVAPETRTISSVSSDTIAHATTSFTIDKTDAAMVVTNAPTVLTESERSFQLINVSKAPWGIQEISDVRINDQPIANFPGASYAYTLGESPEQWYDQIGSPIPRPEAFKVTANTFAQSVELTSTPYVYTTSSGVNVDAIELIFALPFGLVHTSNGSDKNNATRYKARYRLHGASTWINFPATDSAGKATGFDGSGVFTKTAAKRASFFTVARIDHLTPGRYDVEVSFVSADHTDPATDAWKAFLAGVTEEQSNAGTDPGYAKLSVSALAIESLNAATPTISCACKGIKVPWHDGTSWQAPTWYGPDGPTAFAPIGRNPGWLLLESRRDGGKDRSYPAGYVPWGRALPDSKVDIPAWRSFAGKCATTVHVTLDTAVEYDEPMHQLDVTLDTQRTDVEAIRDLLSTARAAPMMNGDKHSVFYDGADDMVQIVTVGNMVKDSFAPVYDFSRKINTFDVTFNDRDRSGDVTTRTVVNDHLVTTLGKPVKRQPITWDGITRWSQVLRDSQFTLRKHEYLKTSCTFEVRTDAILWRAGQVIGVQHELPQWGYGGRVRDGANTTTHVITPIPARLDVPTGSIFIIDTDGNERLFDITHLTYEVRVRLADGSGEEGQLRTVSSGSVTGGHLAVNVTAPFTSAPQWNDVIAFGELGKSVKPFRCIAITRSANSFRKITCIEYNGTIYPSSGVVTTLTYSDLQNYGAAPGPITQCVAHEDLGAQTDASTISTVVIDWTHPANAAGFGFYKGADVEVSLDGKNFRLLNHVPGTQYHWPSAPQEISLWFRVTPYSTSDKRNLAGRCVSAPIICHGSQSVPANVSGLVASVEGDSFVWRWTDISREMQYEGRDVNSGFGTADSHRVFIGRMTEYKINAPSTRSKTIYVKAFQPTASAGTSTPIYSATAASATASKAAPAAPAIGARVTNKDTIKIPVGAASDPGVTGIRLWASQTNGFTPSAATQAAQIVPASGGDFIFHITTPGTWYFRVAATDALTDRLGDYSYSGQFTSAIVVIAPQSPAAVTFAENGTAQRRRATTSPASTPPTLTKVFSLFLNWSFTDSVNPAGSHIGFYVEIYQSGGDPEVPYLSATIADTAARSWPISDITFEASATWVGAVKALYVDGGESSLITSTGLALNPATGDDVLAQLKLDSHGGYYSTDTKRITAADGTIVTIDKNGVWTTGPDGIQRAPRRVSHALLRGATSGQFVSWTDANLDPPLMPNVFGTAASKLHLVTQLRVGPAVDMQPLYHPTRTMCEATEISAQGFRLSLSQCDGGVSQVLRAAADNSGNWTVNGAADGAATAVHGSPMLLAATQNPTDTAGKAAWYDPLAVNNGWPIVIRDIMTFAADMPTVAKSDGTFYYVDLQFVVARVGAHLAWNGTYASLPAGSYNLWDAGVLRAYTNGKRWRMPWTAMFQSGLSQSFVMWWASAHYETGTTSGASAPTRVLMDAFDSHGVLSSGATPASWRGSLGNEDIDILLIEDN